MKSTQKNSIRSSTIKDFSAGKGIALAVFTCFILFTLVSAEQETLGTFKQNDCVRLVQQCGNCTYNNITSVMLPNSTAIVTNANMTEIGTEYEYNFCTTSLLGTYIVNGVGDLDGDATSWAYDFKITKNGDDLSTAQGIIYVIIFLVAIFLFLLLTYATIKFPWGNNRNDEGKIISLNNFKYVKILFFFLSYLSFMWIISISRAISLNFLLSDYSSGLFSMIFGFLLSFIFPLFVMTLVLSVVLFFQDKKINHALTRGVPFR